MIQYSFMTVENFIGLFLVCKFNDYLLKSQIVWYKNKFLVYFLVIIFSK